MEKNYSLTVNENHQYSLSLADVEKLDVQKTGGNTFHILNNNKPYHIEVLDSNFLEKTYTVQVNSATYKVVISDSLDLLIKDMGFALSSTKNISTIEAPMPGLILDINVSVGQEVKEDDPLVILEAMKMENVITSPRDGVIKAISVSKGEAVDKKHILVEFE